MKKKKILLVEDDFPTIDVYKIGLGQAGFELEIAITGQEALEKIEEMQKDPNKKPDLALLDIMLPDMNGSEVLKAIRKSEATRDIKVFVLSNYTSQDLERMGLLSKTEKYLLKTDLTPRELAKLVKQEVEG